MDPIKTEPLTTDAPPSNPRAFTSEELNDSTKWGSGTKAPPVVAPIEPPVTPEVVKEPEKSPEPKTDETATPEEVEDLTAEQIEAITDPKLKAQTKRLWAERVDRQTQLDEVKRAQAGTDRRLTETQKELDAANEAVKEKTDAFKGGLSTLDTKYMSDRKLAMQNETIANNAAADLQATIKQYLADDSSADVSALTQQLADTQQNAIQWRDYGDGLRYSYNIQRTDLIKGHVSSLETAFLDKFNSDTTPYRDVTKDLDQFISQTLGQDPVMVKADMKSLKLAYDLCLRWRIGDPENLKQITEKNKTLALEGTRIKNAASGPGSGSSVEAPKTLTKSEQDWFDKHFPNDKRIKKQ